jgi:hypothetical protein
MRTRIGCLTLATAAAALANTQIVRIQTTNTQALVWVRTDQPGNCTYRISESDSLTPVVNDTSEALFPGSSSDARPGSVVQGNDHSFVAGTRKADPGLDGRWYSRALAADTAHFGGVTCGSDAEVPFQFTTSMIPLGDTYAEPIPFDSRALGNYGLPTFDFADLTKMYIDPQTGFKFRLLTGPGQGPESMVTVTGALGSGGSTGNINGAAAGTNWTSPSSALVADGSMASYTPSAQDVLTLRLAATCGPGGECAGYNWQNVLGAGSGFHTTNIDSYRLTLTGNGGGSTIQVDAALSWNGVTQGTEWTTLTLPASTGSVTFPSAVNLMHGPWQGVNYPLIPGMHWHTIQQRYDVNTSGVTVTLTQPPSTFTRAGFSLDPRILTGGSKITINGTEYTIASVDSATQVTLTASAGTQSNVTAYTFNFSVMIRKHTASAGTVNVDGATVTLAFSNSFGNGGSGFQQFCSALTSTDAQGHVGRFCMFPSPQGVGGIFWVTDDLQVRFIGRAAAFGSSLGVPQDEYSAIVGGYVGQSKFDATDANSWWLGATLTSGGHPTLVKATYNPSGVSGCTQTANYQNLLPDANYSENGSISCNIVYTEITRPSQGKDIWSALNPTIKSGKFPFVTLSFAQNGVAIFGAYSSQDSEAWIVAVSLSTGAVTGQYSTYMNSANGSCRACVLHSVGASNPTDPWYYLVFNNYPGGSAASGLGPYVFSVNTALTTTPANLTCAGVTDPSVTWMIPYSAGCDNITLTASDNIPCDSDPSSWETSNMSACSWHSSWTQWQAGTIKPGDWIHDPAATDADLMVFAQNVSGSTWTVLRAVNVPQGPTMTQASSAIVHTTAHSAGWTASLYCNFHQNAFVQTSELSGSGLLWDRKFFGFNHSVMRSAGIISAEFYSDIGAGGESVRIGALPGAANTPETARVRNTAPFSGKTGLSGTNFIQSHAGWDGVAGSFTDMAPLAPASGGFFTLWPQPGVVNVAGSLYKIPAANAFIAHDKRRRASAVWSGMYNFQDVSGTSGISGSALDRFRYCSIDYVGATCGQANEAPGDVFMNIPQATIDGNSGGAYDLNRANAVPLGQEPLAVLQYYFNNLSKMSLENLGRWERRITTGFARYNGQDTYSNAKVLFNSNLLIFNCATPNLQRIQDVCVGRLPADPPVTTVARNDFLQIPIPVDGRAQYAEIQFGYAENGGPDQFFCTSRQEACNTSSPAGVPYNWEGEMRSLQSCNQGCTIRIPAIPGRLVYYRLRWSDDGTNWNSSSLGVTTAPPFEP